MSWNILKNKKLLFGGSIGGAIVLGLLTNAIWEGLKPLCTSLFKLLLNLSILGLDRYKDGIYGEVAKGFHEGTSLQVFIFVYFFVLFVVGCVVQAIFLIRGRVLEKDTISHKTSKRGLWWDSLMLKKGFVAFMIVYLLFTGTLVALEVTKQEYINSAATYYRQLLHIVDPFISDEKTQYYESQFSQISNRADYIKVIDELKNLAKENNQKIPDFSFVF